MLAEGTLILIDVYSCGMRPAIGLVDFKLWERTCYYWGNSQLPWLSVLSCWDQGAVTQSKGGWQPGASGVCLQMCYNQGAVI